MTEEARSNWENHVKAVTDVMNRIVAPSVVPLSRSDDDNVRLVGTGTLVTLHDMMFILTCRHVADQGGDNFKFEGNDLTYRLPIPYIKPETVLDSAVLPIPPEVWTKYPHCAGFLEVEQFAEKHDPVPRELFFFRGYSQENSAYGFDMLETNATGVGTQINEAFEANDRFFYVLWDPRFTEFTPGTSEEAKAAMRKEIANGFSGSLVFDTGFVRAFYEKREWSVTDARITGQVVNWDQHNHQLVVRRIEDVSEWMRGVLLD